MTKNGKPVVPGPNDKRNQDIKQELPKGHEKMKLPKAMEVKKEKISFKDGDANQYRNTKKGIDEGTDCNY